MQKGEYSDDVGGYDDDLDPEEDEEDDLEKYYPKIDQEEEIEVWKLQTKN